MIHPPTPWQHLRPEQRRWSVAEVRRRGASLAGGAGHRYEYPTGEVRPAAALVPVVDSDGEAAVVVTKRPSTMQYHRDDWVFPGGRIHTDDGETAWEGALREMEEELGVPAAAVASIGHLNTYGPFITGFLLDVFVASVDNGVTLVPDPREVAAAAVVPLTRLMEDGAYYEEGLPEGHDPGPASGVVRPRRQTAATRAGPGRLRYFSFGPDEQLWGTQGEIAWDLLTHLVATK